MKMKTTLLIATVSLALSGCGSINSGINYDMSIQPGMNRQQLLSLMGEPNYRRFYDNVEQLEFHKSRPLQYDKVYIIELVDNKVINMDSFEDRPITTPVNPPTVCPPTYPNNRPTTYPYDNRFENQEDFNKFYNTIKNIPFQDDQLEVLRKGVRNRVFTCDQCIKLMTIRNFDDEKLKFLEIIAPKIRDLENSEKIVNSLSFISSEKKARQLLDIKRD